MTVCSRYPIIITKHIITDFYVRFLSKNDKYNDDQSNLFASVYSGSNDLDIKNGGINENFNEYIKNSNKFMNYQQLIKNTYTDTNGTLHKVEKTKIANEIPNEFEHSYYKSL